MLKGFILVQKSDGRRVKDSPFFYNTTDVDNYICEHLGNSPYVMIKTIRMEDR